MRASPRRRIGLVTTAVVCLVLTGCTAQAPPIALGENAPSAAASPAGGGGTTVPAQCRNAEDSYPPSAGVRGYVDAIRSKGRLVVGVSADTLNLGSRNPRTGAIEGFDIDMAKAVSSAIFGDNRPVEFRVISAAQRIPSLQNGSVDLVVRNMTITCDRWTQIAFSEVYYQAHMKVTVAGTPTRDGTLKPKTFADMSALAGHRVCAPAGSTTLDHLKQDFPKVIPVAMTFHTDCLALFQQGQVDAVAGDDAVLAGFAVQDPYALVLPTSLSNEPYGIGVSLKHPELVQFVNQVLENMRGGQWQTSYNTWLAKQLGPGQQPATPTRFRAT
jgi:polar amino acid transport system substrate-binding protein